MPVGDHLRLLVQGVRRISFDGENVERNRKFRADGGIFLIIVLKIQNFHKNRNNHKKVKLKKSDFYPGNQLWY